MAEMDRSLGGEYIFDRAFLESSVRELSGLVYQVVYSLNAMSSNRYVALYDRYQSVKGILDDILAGGMGPYGASLTLPYSVLGVEMEPLAGGLNVCLAEARNRLDIPAPDGFAVTVAGCSSLIEAIGGEEKEFPPQLAEAINYQIEALFERCAGPVPLTVRISSSAVEPEPQGKSVESNEVLEACRLALVEYLASTDAKHEDSQVALAIHETVSAHLAGSISIASVGSPGGFFCVTAWPVGAPDLKEHFFLRRTYPFDLVESEIREKPADKPLHPAGTNPLSYTIKSLRRGSALLGPSFLRNIAEYAVAFERILGSPRRLDWLRGASERPVIVGVSQVDVENACAEMTQGEDTETRRGGEGLIPGSRCLSGAGSFSADGHEAMLIGGETVQTGIAAGPVVHVIDGGFDRHIHGAVLIMKDANPGLGAALRGASAVVTEIGTSIGHLATIARELRVPAIFGAAGVMERLPEGTEVTVDAAEKTIYLGIVESLLASRESGAELYPTDPEYAALRRLLRWIMPLDLIDPDSAGFTVANCRTYHDIIHFAHERSIEELLKIQDNGPELKGNYVRKLEIDMPIDLFVLDIGGGVSAAAGDFIRMDEVNSKPFLAFLQGLTFKEVWDRNSMPLSVRDVISGLDRTFSAINNAPEYAGKNHAILAGNYMNVGLRLGYHYSVIDSYLSGNVNQNYVYFRFAGGFADENHRRRRAEFIRGILERLRFRAAVKGDLVLGKLKLAVDEEIVSALRVLGELTAFTRQIDLAMDSEDKIEELTRLFREKSGSAVYGQ